jgi:hypothetical protein
MGGMGGPVDHPKGMTILILGILSVTCCTPLGIVAFVMGNNALKEIDAQPGRYGNRQIVQLGRILGIIGMVFLVISIIWFCSWCSLGLVAWWPHGHLGLQLITPVTNTHVARTRPRTHEPRNHAVLRC